jgi:hypothetical protein
VSAIPSRTDRYLARVDAHLPTLADDAQRRRFLRREIANWENRYGEFQATEGASAPGADAADFLLTILGLVARRDALNKPEAA